MGSVYGTKSRKAGAGFQLRGRQLTERRKELLQEYMLGVDFPVIAEGLSKKYGVSDWAIYKDWEKRSTWIEDVTGFEDGQAATFQLLHFLKWLIKRSSLEILQGDNSAARIGAIKAGGDLVTRVYTILKDIGKITTVPEEVDVTFRFDRDGDDNDSLPSPSETEPIP